MKQPYYASAEFFWHRPGRGYTHRHKAPFSANGRGGRSGLGKPVRRQGLRRTLSAVARLAPLVSRGGERRPTGSRAAGLKAHPCWHDALEGLGNIATRRMFTMQLQLLGRSESGVRWDVWSFEKAV